MAKDIHLDGSDNHVMQLKSYGFSKHKCLEVKRIQMIKVTLLKRHRDYYSIT